MGETLDSVIHQLEPCVNILISDNASTDETAQIVQKYQAKHPQIHYRRNPKNVGADKNYEIAIRCSCGKYVWLFSDDDIFEKNSIKYIVDTIKCIDQNFGLILVDCRVINFTQNRILIDGLNPIRTAYCLPKGNSFLHDPAREMPGVISTIIVKRQLLDALNFTPLVGTHNLQVGVAFYLAKIAHTLVLDKKLFMFRRDDEAPRWIKDSYDINFYFCYERAASFGLGNPRLISFLVKPKLWLLPRYLSRIRRVHRSLKRRESLQCLFAQDLLLYRHATFWVTLPLLLFYIFTPTFVFRAFTAVKNISKRTAIQKAS